MTKQLHRAGCSNFAFFPAIDGSNLAPEQKTHLLGYDDQIRRRYQTNSLSSNIIALAATHFLLYEHLKQNHISLAIILEDDAILTNFPIAMSTLSDLPLGWDVLLLESWISRKPPNGKIHDYIYNLSSYRGGSAAYLINSSGIEKLLSIRRPLIHPPDGLFTWFNKHSQETSNCYGIANMPTLDVYLYYPQPFLNGSLAGYWKTTCDTYSIVY